MNARSMADSSYHKEQLSTRLRQLLNRDKVKLWETPYVTEDGTKIEIPEGLISQYSAETGLTLDQVSCTLSQLRDHALEKLSARKRFQDSGIASIKVKLAGHLSETFKESNPNSTLSFDVSLKTTGLELKAKLSEQTAQDMIRLKLICGGRVLDDDRPLEVQSIRNMCTVMCLVLSHSEAEARQRDKETARVADTRKAAELLSDYKRDEDDENSSYYLQIADQTGRPIELPNEERKALALAMTLHEKGRAAIKRKEYTEAILLLLEADKEFLKCRADILKAVDNYALVCLDIVWCYLCLKSVNDLPDAEMRLKACEACFNKSYGENMERLAKVKGETGEELALYLRLHLLQGILAFHQHQIPLARTLLNKADNELKSLHVDEDKMTQVLTMGFTPQEARLGLRASQGNVQGAIAHIMKRKEEKIEQQANIEAEKKLKASVKKLGKTVKGQDVNGKHYESLQSMGFGKGAAAAALRQTNNDIMAAIQALQDHPDLLTLPDPDPGDFKVTDEMLSQVTAMGFEVDQARAALHHFRADTVKAIDELLQIGGVVPQAWQDELCAASSSSTSPTNTASGSPTKSPEEKARDKEAIDSIVQDLPEGHEDHLDLDLDSEASFLHEYLARLSSLT